MNVKSLFDDVRVKADLTYLSDIHTEKGKESVIDAIVSINPEEYSLKEWSELVQYISSRNPVLADKGDAKRWLLCYLS